MTKLCTRCLERFERLAGRKVKAEPSTDCMACRGIFDLKDSMIGKAVEALKGKEFQTFWAGCTLPDKVLDFEKELKKELGIQSTSGIKQDLNKELGLALSEAIGKEARIELPDIIVLFDYIGKKVKLELTPLFVYGRYLKLERGIPQTKWPCRNCRGRGCAKCEGTGKQYKETVEELIAAPFLKASGSDGESFHGGGREDIDARMLGNGRPFVLELLNPVKRSLDWKALEKETNDSLKGRIEVRNLKPCAKEEIARLKAAAHDKEYEALVALENPLTTKEKELLESIKDLGLDQFTPERVQHRRAHLTRKKKIYSVKVMESSGNTARLAIKAEAGAYIKEFISGDNGNTKPSISSILGQKALCTELDVVNVAGD